MFFRSELWKSLVTNPTRVLLSILSIALGSASLIALVSLTQGYAKQLEDLNFGLASTRVSVTENYFVEDRYSGPTVSDWQAIRHMLGAQLAASFTRSSTSYTARVGVTELHGSLYGVLGDYNYDLRMRLSRGRGFSSDDLSSADRICILGNNVASKLFPSGSVIGQQLRINGAYCKIVGVSSRLIGRNAYVNDAVFMPFWGFVRLDEEKRQNIKSVDVIEFFVADETARRSIIASIDKKMRQRHGAPAAGATPFLIGDNLGSTEAANEQRKAATTFLISLAGIALITGVLGVANSMLANVSERQREIGIRLAIGATPKDIGIQFLMESVLLACCGVFVGLVIGLVSAALIGAIYEWPFILNLNLILLAVFTALASGISAGLLPAIKAARFPPAMVIRQSA